MTGHLLLVSLGVHFSHASATWKAAQTMAAQEASNGCVQYFNVLITLKIPNDPHGTEVVLATQIDRFLRTLTWRSIGVPFGNGAH